MLQTEILELAKGGNVKEIAKIANINNKQYILKVAKSEKDKQKGLSNIKELPHNVGMLFEYDTPQDVLYWMKDTFIPLDIIFVDDNDEVISVKQGTPESLEPIHERNVSYVIELNVNSGVKEDDDVDIETEDDEDDKLPVMKVLAPDGSTQMELEGGERIVSRRETKILIKKAKKADKTKKDSDYKALGKYIFKVFKKQDARDPEYVDSPKESK